MTPGAGTNATATTTFRAFFDTWLSRHQYLLDELLQIQQATAAGEDNSAAVDHLVTRVLAHYQNYYTHKTRLANANAFAVFNPPWFSTLEKTYLWVSGFKPALIIRVAANSVNDLTEEQAEALENLREETRARERTLDDHLARIQEGMMASPQWVDFFRSRAGPSSSQAQRRPVDGEINQVGDHMQVLQQKLAQVVREADRLRMTTTDNIVEILKPCQSAKMFVAFIQLFFRIRARGAQMEGERVQREQPALALHTNGW